MDLDLLLTLGRIFSVNYSLCLQMCLSVDEKNSEFVTRIVVESIEKKTSLMKEIEELQFHEIWNVGENVGQLSVDDLFAALADSETHSKYLQRFSKRDTEHFSPLSLTIAKTSSSFCQEFLQKYFFLFSDSKTFCQLLQLISLDRTNNFHEYVQSVVDGTSTIKRNDRKVSSISMIKSKISEHLHHSEPGSSEEIKQILQETPTSLLSQVLHHAVDKIASMNKFSPFNPTNFTRNVVEILGFSDEKLKLDHLSESFASDILKSIKQDRPEVDQEHLALSFKLLPLPNKKLDELLEVLTGIKVNKISSSSTLKTIITGNEQTFLH